MITRSIARLIGNADGRRVATLGRAHVARGRPAARPSALARERVPLDWRPLRPTGDLLESMRPISQLTTQQLSSSVSSISGRRRPALADVTHRVISMSFSPLHNTHLKAGKYGASPPSANTPSGCSEGKARLVFMRLKDAVSFMADVDRRVKSCSCRFYK